MAIDVVAVVTSMFCRRHIKAVRLSHSSFETLTCHTSNIMKVYSLSLLAVNAATPATSTNLCQVNDLASFSFYQRGSVGEFMGFFTKTVAERTQPNTPASVEENSYKAHVFRTSAAPGKTGLAVVMITDLEYPYRPAFSLITKILDEQASLATQLPTPSPDGASSAANPSLAAAGGLSPAQKGKIEATLQQYLTKYQDPTQADTIMKVQKELDETKIVLVSRSQLDCYCQGVDSCFLFVCTQHKTIESVLERGEKLDNLVERSNALSNQSKMFYRTAKKVSLGHAPSIDGFPFDTDCVSALTVSSKTLVVWSCKGTLGSCYTHMISMQH